MTYKNFFFSVIITIIIINENLLSAVLQGRLHKLNKKCKMTINLQTVAVQSLNVACRLPVMAKTLPVVEGHSTLEKLQQERRYHQVSSGCYLKQPVP